MPYRRLPNTDEARIRSLRLAVNMVLAENPNNMTISFRTLDEARSFLDIFEITRRSYKQNFEQQVRENKKYQPLLKQAQLYISHFIQVINLCVIRGEIKKEYKTFYGLNPDNFSVPEMTSENAVMEWGRKIIEGEQRRIANGGIPIYTPTIAKVTVHYDVFKDGYLMQKNLKGKTAESLKSLSDLRERGDAIILDIWNQVEKKYESLPLQSRLDKCKQFGVIYYLRKDEKEGTEETTEADD
ncbi:MAG: hypothetical protein FWF54_06230 [Candidatus Azobacteroides sp.]|nr:hypothetical protein [Candidatus Azobacteroides sp.]